MRVSLQPAYVLHSRPYRETSLLVEVFSLGHGRIGLVAKGARRAKSPFRGLLQPFRPLLLSWSGQQELMLLIGGEPDGPAHLLAGKALNSGFYLNELLMRLLHRNDAHPDLYQAYLSALTGLEIPNSVEPVLRIFEKRLLGALGYGLLLDREAVSNAAIRSERRYYYVVERGPIPFGTVNNMGVQVSGQTLLELSRERLEGPRELKEAKSLMRHVLGNYLGDRPLETRKLFN